MAPVGQNSVGPALLPVIGCRARQECLAHIPNVGPALLPVIGCRARQECLAHVPNVGPALLPVIPPLLQRGSDIAAPHRNSAWRAVAWVLLSALLVAGADRVSAVENPTERGALPVRVHVFEDYETEIEKRWWLRGVPESNNVPPGSSGSIPNRRACRAAETKDFDDKMGDPAKTWKAVVFNPVPGPPMGPRTRLGFRYWLNGTTKLRVQIYSLSNDYHRRLELENLPQSRWESATVDMTRLRRPDGSGGPLSEDERIDDIQFYVEPAADLFIDDIVLYEAAPDDEPEPFPRRVIFTGWFDTGQQGAGHEWPGDFEIVPHERPLTWKCAKSVVSPGGEPWIRVNLRGLRPLGATNRLRFLCKSSGVDLLQVVLANSATGQQWSASLEPLADGEWATHAVDFSIGGTGGPPVSPSGGPPLDDQAPAAPGTHRPAADATMVTVDEIRFHAPKGGELRVDDVLLFEPAASTPETSAWAAPMRDVHARFTGRKGTVAHFGDSITVTMAYWAPLADAPKNMDQAAARAHAAVKSRLRPECWRDWKGPDFGSDGGKTIRWAFENVDRWLTALNPEVAVIMFGSNDVDQLEVAEYESKTREVVSRCLRNGTIVVLTTPPPRSGRLDKCREFAEAVRRIARERNVPLVDYFREILRRRPTDWDGALPQFKSDRGDEYQVPTLVARDGVHPSNPAPWVNDFSTDALRRSGYTLRNHLTLAAVADVITEALQP